MDSQQPENTDSNPSPADAGAEADQEGFNQALIRGKMRIADKGQAKQRMSGGRVPEGEVQGTGPANRHGMPQLPPGQHEVKNWPVLDLGVQPAIPRDLWSLAVKGYVEQPYVLEWKESGNEIAVRQPDQEGFGSRLMRISVEGQLGGQFHRQWDEDGVRVHVTVPLASIVRSSKLAARP